MYELRFRNVVDPPWLRLSAVAVGSEREVCRDAARYVTVGTDEVPLVRIDLFAPSEAQAYVFEEALIWDGCVVIGWGERVHFVDLTTRLATIAPLDCYFGHLYVAGESLLAASGQSLFCFRPGRVLAWQSEWLGVDGVLVNSVDQGIISGEGEWDPPGGWRPFSVRLEDGKPVSGPS